MGPFRIETALVISISSKNHTRIEQKIFIEWFAFIGRRCFQVAHRREEENVMPFLISEFMLCNTFSANYGKPELFIQHVGGGGDKLC